MSDRPIPLLANEVRALLAGTKTQMRRVLKPQPYDFPHPDDGHRCWNASGAVGGRISISDVDLLRMHRIAVGDRLWVLETWRTWCWNNDVKPSNMSLSISGHVGANIFYATDEAPEGPGLCDGKVRASIHMPRWASRLTLHVTDVRVQRLQEISEEDARAEGIVLMASYPEADSDPSDPLVGYSQEEAWSHDPNDPASIYEMPGCAKHAYRRLWRNINGPGSWDKNPWVAAYTFTAEHCNIDQARPSP